MDDSSDDNPADRYSFSYYVYELFGGIVHSFAEKRRGAVPFGVS